MAVQPRARDFRTASRNLLFIVVLLGFLLGASPLPARAAGTGAITGVVKDATSNLPITDYSIGVAAYNKNSGALIKQTCSNPATGQYTLSGLPLGIPVIVLADGNQANISSPDCPNSIYGYEYWNNTPVWNLATAITLTTAKPNKTAVNFTLSEAVPYVEYLLFNFDNSGSANSLLEDATVRRAIALGTDRQTLLDNYWGPGGQYGELIDSYVAPTAFNAAISADGVPTYAFSPTQARTILDNAGWVVGGDGIRVKDGTTRLSLTYKTTNYPVRQSAGAAFVQQMHDIGIEIFPTYYNNFFDPAGPLYTGNFDIAEFANTECASIEDKLCVPYLEYKTGDPNNLGHYTSAAVDTDFTNAQNATTPADRHTWAVKHQVDVMTDLPALPLFARTWGSISGVVKKLDGTPLTGLSIYVEAVDAAGTHDTLTTACTNPANGYYTLTDIPDNTSVAIHARGGTDCSSNSSFYGWSWWNETGDVSDVSQATPIVLTAAVPAKGGVNLTLGENVPNIEYMIFNLDGTHSISSDKDVRQAIAYGTNRLALLNDAWLPNGEYGTVENSYVADNHWAVATATNSTLPIYAFSQTQATTLLDNAGWVVPPGSTDGIRYKGGTTRLSVTFKTTQAAARQATGAQFVQQMQAIGVEIIPTYIDSGTFFGNTGPLVTRDFDIAEYTTNYCRNTLDEYCVPFAMFHDGDANNTAHYNSFAAEDAYANFQAATTHADRLTYALQHQVIAMGDLPYFPLFTRVTPLSISGNAGVAGAAISWVDGTLKTKVATVTGAYSITVPYGWSGKVTPSKTGRVFTPFTRSYSKLTASKTAQNFTAQYINAYMSAGSQDGWILESGETTNLGGTMNAPGPTFNLGDDALNKQYRAIISFNTATLPDISTIKSATIKILQSGPPVGTNPFTALGSLRVDIRKPYFGTTAALQLPDFNAPPSALNVGSFGKTPALGWYTVKLASAGFTNINKTGTTQVRLYFSTDDNNNHLADFMQFFSGNSLPANRPVLSIIYTVP